jgi:hypothetical protein
LVKHVHSVKPVAELARSDLIQAVDHFNINIIKPVLSFIHEPAGVIFIGEGADLYGKLYR